MQSVKQAKNNSFFLYILCIIPEVFFHIIRKE